MDFSVFRERLHSLMQSKGVQQNVLADAVGVAPATISRVLSGKRDEPSLKLVIGLAEYFDVSVDWLVGNDYMEASVPEAFQEAFLLFKEASEDDKRIAMAILSRNRKKG